MWIAANDRSRPYGIGQLGDGCLQQLPLAGSDVLDTVRLIDVVWVDASTRTLAAAFEVEHSTSIYSGIVRMLDLALGVSFGQNSKLFLVAPDDRRHEVAQQLRRPAFWRVAELGIRYLPYSQITAHGPPIERFGSGLKPLMEISQLL